MKNNPLIPKNEQKMGWEDEERGRIGRLERGKYSEKFERFPIRKIRIPIRQ